MPEPINGVRPAAGSIRVTLVVDEVEFEPGAEGELEFEVKPDELLELHDADPLGELDAPPVDEPATLEAVGAVDPMDPLPADVYVVGDLDVPEPVLLDVAGLIVDVVVVDAEGEGINGGTVPDWAATAWAAETV